MLRNLRRRLRALLRRGDVERELDEELRFHLELETEKNRHLGLDTGEARRQALVAFGGVERVKEEYRDGRGTRWLEDAAADVRFALRALGRSPALAGAAVVTLALGLGANTAIFSAVNAVILRPLPFEQPDRLYALGENNVEKNWQMEVAAPANIFDWRERVAAFADVAAYSSFSPSLTLTGDGEPRRLQSAVVTGNFFSLLGVRPALGRAFEERETWQTGGDVVILSDRAWRTVFGADRGIVGRFVELQGRPTQVVGVMPPGFAFPSEEVDVWAPTAWDPQSRAQVFFRRAHWMRPIARLAPGVSAEQADVQLQQVVEQLKGEYPETNRVMGAGMVPLHDYLVGDTRLPLLVLLGAVALLLLIACANVGNLLLVQAAGRERELSVRVALGARRARLVRQALTESLVLSTIGGLAGLAVGWVATRLLVRMQPEGLLRVRDFGLDVGVFGYVLALTTVSGLLFGIAPALLASRRLPIDALREGGRAGSEGRRSRRWGDLLVVGEVAIALLLSVGAGLLVRSFWELRHVDPGFDASGVITATVSLPGARYDSAAKVDAFFRTTIERLRALPGVTDASATSPLPLTGLGYTSDFVIASHPAGEYGSEVAHRRVLPDYFRTMRVPVLRGRAFTAADVSGSRPVVVINQALAERHFAGQDPVGQRITDDREPDSTSTWYTIVGVVGNEHMESLSLEPRIEMLHPASQDPTSAMTLVARTSGDPTRLVPGLRAVVHDLDPALALDEVRPMTAVQRDSLARARFLTTLLLLFAGIGLVLAIVGVYGVLSQLARRRTREMGIRIALGATGARVRWMIVGHGQGLGHGGLGVGAAAAAMATRAMRGLLFQVPPADPATFVTVAVLLAATTVVASWLPARRASRADPAEVLRGEG
jgi:putative ABC transport system permease protein